MYIMGHFSAAAPVAATLLLLSLSQVALAEFREDEKPTCTVNAAGDLVCTLKDSDGIKGWAVARVDEDGVQHAEESKTFSCDQPLTKETTVTIPKAHVGKHVHIVAWTDCERGIAHTRVFEVDQEGAVNPFDSSPVPPEGTPTDGDANGDGRGDWLTGEAKFTNGTLRDWVIDQANGREDEFHARVFERSDGTKRFIAKCPYEGGVNEFKDTTREGRLLKTTWQSTDEGRKDDDRDDKKDRFRYTYDVEKDELLIEHFEGEELVEKKTKRPPPSGDRFDFRSLPPQNPQNRDERLVDPSCSGRTT